jgi:catechol 2,3-dioxygenase-like lactoylglutathione lyase family enzyme
VTDPETGDEAYDRSVLRVRGVDHLVMNVSDARRSVAWWRDLLGAEPLRVTEWEAGEVAFPSVRLDESTIVDLFELDRTGTNVDHVCVVVEGADLHEVAASGAFEVLGPPMQLFGARGIGTGLYVKDPDGNTVELRTYP